MIDVVFTLAAAPDVIVVDLWEDAHPPTLPRRAIKVEPQRWWLIDGADLDTARRAIGECGAAAEIGGGLVRASVTGSGWRDLLSVSGFLDTESLRPGDVASTVIHHVPVRIAVTVDTACEVYFAASYAEALDELWQRATTGG